MGFGLSATNSVRKTEKVLRDRLINIIDFMEFDDKEKYRVVSYSEKYNSIKRSKRDSTQ